jgi:hypothetical protein
MWEEWNANSRSHDHAFLGTVVDWEYQQVAGIQPAAPGYRKVKIQPYPISGLDHAQAHVDSPYGVIASSWVRKGQAYTLDVTIPVGSTADVYVPVGAGDVVTTSPGMPVSSGSPTADGFQKFTVGSGQFRFIAAPRAGRKPSQVTGPARIPTHRYGAATRITVDVAGTEGVPTGKVSLRNGAVEVGSGRLDAHGRASITLAGTALNAGAYALQLVYPGDGSFAPSSTTVAARITKLKPTLRVAMSKRSYKSGQSPTVKANVHPAAYVDGTVTVKAGHRVLKAHVRVVNGRVKIRLRHAAKRRGLHRLTVIYSGGRNTLPVSTHIRYRVK